MRHLKHGRKLNRTFSHRRAMVRNLVTSLFLHGRVTTTPAKAKEARSFAEKLITLAKDGSLAARRRAISLIHDKAVVKSLFAEIGPRYKDRQGGYTRILRLAKTRVGDSAPQVIFELVEEALPEREGEAARPVATPDADVTASEPAASATDAGTEGESAGAATAVEEAPADEAEGAPAAEADATPEPEADEAASETADAPKADASDDASSAEAASEEEPKG